MAVPDHRPGINLFQTIHDFEPVGDAVIQRIMGDENNGLPGRGSWASVVSQRKSCGAKWPSPIFISAPGACQ